MLRDVVIAGGGPTGLMLACELRLAGISVTVLERLAEPSGLSKPLGLSGRAIDLLDQRGLLGCFSDQAQSFDLALALGGRTPQDLPERPAKLLIVEQARVEELLEGRAVELGASLRWGHVLVGLEPERERIRLEVRDPNGDYQLHTRFLVGCDGEQNTVGDLSRLKRVDEAESDQVERVFLVGEAEFDMCLQDVVNLGRKLAAEIRGWALAGSLDTYFAPPSPNPFPHQWGRGAESPRQ
jgi:2-polyprenyl-6-methoxyphenol hydroxylase-like FAD-dependent oxidoreductase